jgi:Tol biopolymer transport system component
LGALVVLASAGSLQAGGVAILGWHLADNGDGDGFADTRETVTLRLTVRNTTVIDLTGVVATLRTLQATRACLTAPQLVIGSLAAGETRQTTGGFTLVVPAGVQRGSVTDALAVGFRVEIRSDQIADLSLHQEIGLDLDLDATGGLLPRTFSEGFEGVVTFQSRNLDAGLSGDQWCCEPLPPSAGYRCQYSVATCGASCSSPSTCSLGGSVAGGEAFWWAVDPGRAFSGSKSLHMGDATGTTTPASVLEATEVGPIHLGRGRVCETTRTTPCTSATDCPSGQACVDVLPTLSFKHQISLLDSRSLAMPAGQTSDRAVVLAQLATGGTPIGDWIKLPPYLNVYDQQPTTYFGNCMFDPLDDGSQETDLFDPGFSNLGPSSTCYPEYVFANLGDTDELFSPGNLGNADGPGLQGSVGPGTWVESRFSLARFRGRSVRLRFLNTSPAAGAGTWQQILGNVGPGDDGWWIDDVRVEDALTSPATVAVDTRANGGLPLDLPDADADGVFDSCDNCPAISNAAQSDLDRDYLGDACDVCVHDAGNDVDLDGICAAQDNCPELPNPDQADQDADGVGDLCDNCPRYNPTQSLDEDGDGVPCAQDNCPVTANPDQADADADGNGDACDPCALDPHDDADGDGVCGDVDNCPTRVNPEQGPHVELARDMDAFKLLPGDREVLAAGATWADTGLYRIALAAGAPLRITPPMQSEAYIVSFAWTSDLSRAVYVADAEVHERYELYSVPLAGGAATKLNGPIVPLGRVHSFLLTPDGSRAIYLAEQELDDQIQLYSVPVTGGVPVRLSDVVPAGGDVLTTLLTPDGARVVYVADQEEDGVFELYSVAVQGGPAVKLNGPLPAGGDAGSPTVTPDGSRVVFIADQTVNDVQELILVPTPGGAGQVLAQNATGPTPKFTPDSSTVVYQGSFPLPTRLFALPLSVGGGGLAVPLSTSSVTSFALTPQGSFVVYASRQGSGGAAWEVFSAPIGGGTGTRLNGPLVPGGNALVYAISGDGARVVYRADQAVDERNELWSAPVSGGPFVKLNEPVGPPYQVFDDWVLKGNTVVYHMPYSGQKEMFAVPAQGGPSIRLGPDLDVPWPAPVAITDNEKLVLYPVFGTVYVVSLDPDPDGDGVHAPCDNCPGVANPAQQDADGDLVGPPCDCDDGNEATYPGAEEVNDGEDNQCPGDRGHGEVDEIARLAFSDASNRNRATWTILAGAADYEVARSPVPEFAVACVLFSTSAAELTDPALPASGTLFHYLVRASAPHVGSWGHNSQGVERSLPCP